MSQLKYAIETTPFTVSSYSIMDKIAIDTIGPLPECDDGHKYIIVMIDAFSRYVHLYPAKDTTALSAAQAVLSWTGTFGVPSKIMSDNGTQFANDIIRQLLHILGVEHLRINAYSKEENAVVERANKEVNRHLRAMVYETKQKKNWKIFLPLVQRIMNALVHSSTRVSPNQIVFGNAIDTGRGLFKPFEEEGNPTQYNKFVADMLQAQHEFIQIAERTQRDLDQFHIAQRKGDINITEFPINSYVLVYYENDEHQPPSKLHTKLRGPLRVVNRIGSIYTLQNLVNNKLEDFHVKNIRPFIYDPVHTDPKKVALHDEDHFEINNILDHRFEGQGREKRSELAFLILWEGETSPTWHKWSIDLSNNAKVHEYLSAHKMKKFINAKHKLDA
jgi:hypothetical protein